MTTNKYAAPFKGPRKDKNRKSAKSPAARTRAGQTYPGGRGLRRALARLAAATGFYEKATSGGGKAKKSGNAFTKPGSMKP
jgi:hypothetical protein